MNLSEIYDGLIKKEDKKRNPLRLFVTDIGACPRAVAYRMLQTPKNPQTAESQRNKRLMFDLAEYIEENLYKALTKTGQAIDYQVDVPIPRDNWGGRCDIIADYGGRRIIEVKTVRSNAFNYDVLKENHVYQASTYHYCLEESYGLEAEPLVAYFDRGGSNTPQEFVRLTEMDTLDTMMDELEAVREDLSVLPDKLDKVWKLVDRRKHIKEVPDFRCQYCDYSDVCVPDTSTHLLGELEGGTWRFKADLFGLSEWAAVNA